MDQIFNLVPWVVFFPVLGLLVNLAFGRRLSEAGTGLVACLSSGLSFVVSVILAAGLGRAANMPEAAQPFVLHLADWITAPGLRIGWDFRVDTLAVTMMLVVSGVGTLIHVYATRYMHSDVRFNGDPGRYRRFFVYFNLFIAAMMVLVSADNYLMLFVGWEGVGLCSYLLIGFWFEKGAQGVGNARAAKKAFLVNRIGDFGMLLAIFLIFTNFSSLRFEDVFQAAAGKAAELPWLVPAITLFMLLGVTGKSAQIPLFVWLPDAMAGPTPVSALIHAATMVTAGVYLVVRSQPLFVLAPLTQAVTMWIGALTAFLAATIAVGQFDIKKVLAYSTISQLGFMVAAVGMGAVTAGMFHLVTHAFFKALLFLSAGAVILSLEHAHESHHAEPHAEEESFDPQDMRCMGGLQRRLPVTFWVYLAGALALAGIAPLAGFFSKDEILAAASHTSPAVFILLLASAFLTAFYMGRQLMLVFFGRPRTAAAGHAMENPWLITLPLIILAVLSVAGGLLNLPGLGWLGNWLEHTLGKGVEESFSWGVALGSLGLALAGLFLAWIVYSKRTAGLKGEDPLSRGLGVVFRGIQAKWWLDEFYHLVIVRPYDALAGFLARPVDLGVIDAAGNALGWLVNRLAGLLRRMQNGFVRSYALTVLFGVVVILTYLFFWR